MSSLSVEENIYIKVLFHLALSCIVFSCFHGVHLFWEYNLLIRDFEMHKLNYSTAIRQLSVENGFPKGQKYTVPTEEKWETTLMQKQMFTIA